MNIHKTISEFYIKAAEIICNSACHKCCAAKCKCKMNVDVFGDKDTSAILDMFYSMLDDISADIRGNSDTDVQSYGEYYKGTDIIDWDGIIANAERSLSGKISKCKHSDDSQKRLVEKTAQKLAGKVGISRIAEIIYYKENHRYYDKTVESAYTEVVEAVAQDSNDILSKRMYKKVQKTTSEITSAAAQQVYESVYDKPMLKEKYKPSLDKFAGYVSDTPYYLATTNMAKKRKLKMWYDKKEYYKKVVEDFDEGQYISWESCFKDKKDRIPFAKNTFLAYVRRYIPDLLGISNNLYVFFFGNYRGKYVAKIISDELVDIVIECNAMFSSCGKRRKVDSSFMLVNSMDDLVNFNYVVETYIQVVVLRLLTDKCQKLLEAAATIDNKAKEEVAVLISATNYMYRLKPMK
ncbi:MAG: hypothetical protein IJO91_11500 [Oscillospiraceae bacterium]|nr:hypothetical protein [Oscillospiraceae bacterium]